MASEDIKRNATIAISVGLIWGFGVGLILSLLLVLSDNAFLIFPNPSSSIAFIVFLSAIIAFISAIVLQPLAVFLKFERIHPVRLYVSFLTFGLLLILIILWLALNVLRPPKSTFSLFIYGCLTLTTIAVVLLLSLQKEYATSPIAPQKTVIALVSLLLCLLTVFVSYRLLADNPQLTGIYQQKQDTNTAISEIKSDATPGNLLMISIDTLRADHLNSYGYRRITSPYLDRLAADSVVFTNARAAAPWTLPSHASLFTGLYPSMHGARFSSQHVPYIDPLNDSATTIAEKFQAAGLRTGAFTTSHWFDPRWGLNRGFTDYQMQVSQNATQLVRQATEWMEREGNEPFFLFLHFFDVHNYSSPAEFERRYVDGKYAGPLKGQKLVTSRNTYSRLTESDLGYLIARYDAALNYVDSEVGKLIEWLQAQSLYDNTRIIVTSDHGEEFWEHGGTGHGFTLYEESVRVPLIIKPLPTDTRQPERIQASVSLVDIAPTVLDYSGIKNPSVVAGRSLRSQIEGKSHLERPVYAEDTYFLNTYCVIQNSHKYIENRVPPSNLLNPLFLFVNVRSFFKYRANELYNLSQDPQEKENVLKSEQNHSQKMRGLLLQHIKIENQFGNQELDEQTIEQLRSLGYTQ